MANPAEPTNNDPAPTNNNPAQANAEEPANEESGAATLAFISVAVGFLLLYIKSLDLKINRPSQPPIYRAN